MLTAEQIAARAEHLDGRANRAEINRLYRRQDESRKWPIMGRFDATERAIKRVQTMGRWNGPVAGLEYAYAIEGELGRIINGSV